ncbi:hypothetical protein [Planomonospora venezuelensis]|uniref:Uncharacterized protein n=1 Tax=Planomonospora venezuelensis TaxID=1999 RepID=A0A841D0M4_PLAVE|nr:hypothetical protein [Planomonospora venezuelensis]MBB5962074.1 hypothetical protein [Planomonospora venezuelensis]GIN00175.1 hypothetical protein Pve01_18330 [Planomonospora venezuelensis]
MPALPLAAIPSPPEGVWYPGPIPIRGYTICILLGVVVAVVIAERRWRDRGGVPGAREPPGRTPGHAPPDRDPAARDGVRAPG